MPRYSIVVGKILELLATGSLIGFTKNRQQRLELIKEADYVWQTIDRKELRSILDKFKVLKYIETKENKIFITEKGKARRLKYQLQYLRLKKSRRWDKKWRMVLFDIPESKKKIRDALRRKLKELEFLEFQKSVFVYPYSCRDEINFVINFFDISDMVYYLEAPISPDDFLRKHFKLK